MAVQMLSNLQNRVEGNSMISIDADIVVFVAGRESDSTGAEGSGMADIIIADDEPPQGLPERTERFHSADVERCVEHIVGRIKKIK
jgi:hypothetical protein